MPRAANIPNPLESPGNTASDRAAERREHILAAAERCFARSGFHATSMQQICAEAQMSPGNLYRYFPSKEALITGICARDCEAVTADFTAGGDRDPFEVLSELARHAFDEMPRHKLALRAEVLAETLRNAEIASFYREADATIRDGMLQFVTSAVERGYLPADIDPEQLVELLKVMGDGFLVRRIVDPNFTTRSVAFLGQLLRAAAKPNRSESSEP